MTTWNPSSCHVAYLLGNTTITRSAVDSSSGNTHFAPSVSNKSLSVVSLQSSLFCKLVYEANTVDSCVLCLFTVPYLIFNNFPCRFRTRPICSSNPWRSSERSKSESQKWALLLFFFADCAWIVGSDTEPSYEPTASWAAYTSQQPGQKSHLWLYLVYTVIFCEMVMISPAEPGETWLFAVASGI